jgi:hypothetical protein
VLALGDGVEVVGEPVGPADVDVGTLRVGVGHPSVNESPMAT